MKFGRARKNAGVTDVIGYSPHKHNILLRLLLRLLNTTTGRNGSNKSVSLDHYVRYAHYAFITPTLKDVIDTPESLINTRFCGITPITPTFLPV